MKISMIVINRTAEALIDGLNKIYLNIDLVGEVCRMLNRFDIK